MQSASHAPPVAGQRGLQFLNSMDRIILAIDEVLREQGGIGLETQAILWLDGRIDPAACAAGLARLSRKYPVLTARLEKGGKPYAPAWRMRRGAPCLLQERGLDSTAARAVVDLGTQLMKSARSLESDGPISFYLVHGADGHDAMLVQYNHVLMDIHGVVPLLTELDRLMHEGLGPAVPDFCVDEDPLTHRLAGTPRRRMISSTLRSLDMAYRELRGPCARLADGVPRARTNLGECGCLIRSIDAPATRALEQRVTATCGFPSLSMALLASAFRAVGRLIRKDSRDNRLLSVPIGLDLGLRPADHPIFRNLVSLVPLHAFLSELADRDELTRLLAARLRARLRHAHDWGIVDTTRLVGGHPWILRAMARGVIVDGLSFRFSYFGSMNGLAPTFCGAELTDFGVVDAGAPPTGLNLVTHKFRGALRLHATYTPALVSEALAEDFLQSMVEDLMWRRG